MLARIVRHMKSRHMDGEDHPLRFAAKFPPTLVTIVLDTDRIIILI